MRCSSQHFICRTSLLPFAVASGMATLEEALPPIEGDYVDSPTKKAKLAEHQLQTLNLATKDTCGYCSSRLGPGACERCGRILITVMPDHYDVCTSCFRGLCNECGATCDICFGTFCHGFCQCGCQLVDYTLAMLVVTFGVA